MSATNQNTVTSGPIQISPNHRYFVDAKGQPFFWLGDTSWPLFSKYTQAEAEKYLQNRADKGFTVIQAVLVSGAPDAFGSEAETSRPNAAGDKPWLDNDPTRPNDAYFRHVDDLVQFAAQRGMVMAVLPVWGSLVNQAKTLNPTNARTYGRWLGKRYKDQPNIVWVNGGDREPLGCEETYRDLALGLREGDGGAHLITFHPCGTPRSSSQFWHNEDWLDFNMIETWMDWFRIYSMVQTDLLMVPPKPVVLSEPAYEDGPEYPLGPITPQVMRRQAWWTFMAGGFFTYGQNQMWRMEPGWIDTALDTPGASQMTQFKAIANLRPWWKMIPDQSFFASGIGSERTLNTALRTLDRACAMLYFSSACHALVTLDIIATKRVRATWVNPLDSTQLDGGEYDTGNGKEGAVFPSSTTHWFTTPPRWEDAVLILDGC